MERKTITELLDALTQAAKNTLSAKLTGVYLHGSLAMGCFNEKKSDIDLLYVVNAPLTKEEKGNFLAELVCMNRLAPAKGIEMSVVNERDMKPFVHPAPFQLHFSNAYLDDCRNAPDEFIGRMHGTDRDLAAHVKVTGEYGIRVFGKEIPEVFGEVPRESYLDALLYDIENAREDMKENPMYVTFSLSRILAYVKEGKCLSKKDGALWAISNIDKRFEPLLLEALEAYGSDREISFTPLHAEFAEYMLFEIEKRIK